MTQPDFIIIPTRVLLDQHLQPNDRLLMGYIYWLARLSSTGCTASNKTLADLMGAHEHGITRSLQRLEEAGYITRHDDGNHHRTYIECHIFFGKSTPPNNGGGDTPTDVQNNSNIEIYNTNTTNVVLGASPEAAPTAQPQDKRRLDITEVVEKFETVMQLRLTRMPYQRRAAHTLIARYGPQRVLASIDAVAAVRDFEYAPQILSLEDLRDKWNNLEEFYRKKTNPQQGGKGGLAVV